MHCRPYYLLQKSGKFSYGFVFEIIGPQYVVNGIVLLNYIDAFMNSMFILLCVCSRLPSMYSWGK